MKHFLLSALLLAGLVGCTNKQEDAPAPSPTPQQLLLGTWGLEKYVETIPVSLSRPTHRDSILYSPPSALYGVTYQADGTWLGGTGTAGTYNTGTYTYAPPVLSYGNATTYDVLQLTSQKLVVRSQRVVTGFTYTTLWYYTK